MVEINNTPRQKIAELKVRRLVEKFLCVYKKTDYDVSVAVVGERAIKKVNYRYRGINKTTDVLSFLGTEKIAVPRARGKTGKYLGEVIINLEEAEKTGRYFSRESKTGKYSAAAKNYSFYFVLVHGLLHLLGYDDGSEKERREMLDLGQRFLESFENDLFKNTSPDGEGFRPF
jgi:probable rRNA maturation factor